MKELFQLHGLSAAVLFISSFLFFLDLLFSNSYLHHDVLYAISLFCFVVHDCYCTPVNVNLAFTYSEILFHSSFLSLPSVPIVVAFPLWGLSTNTGLTECCFWNTWYRQFTTLSSIFDFSPKSSHCYFNYYWCNELLEMDSLSMKIIKKGSRPTLFCWRPCTLRVVF